MARRGDGIYQRVKTWWLDFRHNSERRVGHLMIAGGKTERSRGVRATSAFALFLVFALLPPIEASAGCAWVGWKKVSPDAAPSSWHIMSAHSSESECKSALLVEHAGNLRELKHDHAKGSEIESVSAFGNAIAYSFKPLPGETKPTVVTILYLCLPDTLDPRAKK